MNYNRHFNPLVSIITIVFNGEAYLKNCIESVKRQRYSNIQYIIIDGGSTDGSLNIINSYSDFISIVISEKDEGISDAFNKGIRMAEGELIGILNSDDLYSEDTVENVVNCYLEGKKGIYYGDICYFNEDLRYELKPELKKIWHYMSIFHPAIFVHKSIYDKEGLFKKDYRYAMDCEFIHRCIRNKVSFFYVPFTLAYFRLGGESDQNYKKSFLEFYKSVKLHNPKFKLGFLYYIFGLLKVKLRKTNIGKYIHKNRKYVSLILSGNQK